MRRIRRRALVSDIESAAAYILSLNQLPGTSNVDNGAVNKYPSFQAADVADGGIKLAATAASQALPTMLAADGSDVNMGCLCGLP